MSSTGRWRTLGAIVEDAPQLLVRTQFGAPGYEIELTDLSHIWRASATKDEIVQQASEIGSSIDPGQDNEQFHIFLSKIDNAINGDNGTTLELHATDEDGSFVSMDLSTNLPKPLPAFTWSLDLKRLLPQDTERLLISPLLRQASQLQHQIQQLVGELHDKDRVISKICDRLETSGNDLTTVFPGVSNIKTNRKKGQREQLAKHVKGLADFDEDAWKAQAAAVRNDGDLGASAINHVLSGLQANTAHSSIPATWWRNLDSVSTNRTNGPPKLTRQSVAPHDSTDTNEITQDDDFQTQSTPPHLRRNSPHGGLEQHASESAPVVAGQGSDDSSEAVADHDDSSTEDEDDLNVAPTRSQLTKGSPSEGLRHKELSPSPRKLGTFGGRTVGRQTSETQQTSPTEQVEPEQNPRSKLGKIGGKEKSAEIATPQPGPEAEAVASGADARPRKMGVMGGMKVGNHAKPPLEDVVQESIPKHPPPEREERPARTSAKAESPAPREASEERADRKRDQLKRELEEKAKAPVKKKRRF